MKLIPKHQNKSPIKKLNWFTKATLNAAMADNPAIMTSAGWNIDSSTGEVKLDNKAFETGSPEEKLRNNLTLISTFSPTHPLNAAFEMAPYIYRGGLYTLGKVGNTAAKNRYFATTLNDIVKETSLNHNILLTPKEGKLVPLYRATGTSGKYEPSLDGTSEFTGMWFTNNPRKPQHYASNTVRKAKRNGNNENIVLQYIELPLYKAEQLKASNILEGRKDIDFEPVEDFLIPEYLEKSEIPLTGYTGNLLQDARKELPQLLSKLPSRTSLAFFERSSFIKTPQITAENAASITPAQWTAAQDAAIARGDMTEAQRLRDLHFKVSASNSVTHEVFHHGNKKPMDWYTFDPARVGTTDEGFSGAGYYFAPTRPASQYVKEHFPYSLGPHGEQNAGLSGGKYHRYVYLNGKTKYERAIGHNWTTHTDLPFVDNRPVEVVVGDNRQIKLADAVTFDDNGARIPLGERDNFNNPDIRYYESPNKEAMKGVNYIEQTPSATSLDAEQQLAQRLESYTPKVGENGLVEYKPLNSNNVINILEEAVEKQIQRYIDSGITREDAIEYLREQFGYGAMTQNGKTFLLPEKYMITNPEYMKAHDAVHRVLRFDDSFNIPGAEGLNPNEAVAMISGEIKPALGIQANEPLTEKMLDKWLKMTNDKITGRYGFSSKIKDKKKFLEWANKVAPVTLPWVIGGSVTSVGYNAPQQKSLVKRSKKLKYGFNNF